MKEAAKRQVLLVYHRYAPLYDFLFGRVLHHGRERLAATVSGKGITRILEVGVGTGLTLDRYPAAAEVVGVDLSRDMLLRARTRSSRVERPVTLLAADAEQLPFLDGTFDCVTLPYVLSVTPNPARLISEVRRVCVESGLIIVLNHFSGSRFWWLAERLMELAGSQAGFRSRFSYGDHIAPHPWTVQSIEDVNFMGLSKLVVIKNG